MAKTFKPNTGTKVTKKEAMTWIDKYDKEMRKDKKKDTKSVFFGRDALLKMLSEDGSSGITFFLALRYSEIFKKETVHLVLVPTKENGELIWPDDSRVAKSAKDTVAAYDNALPCPPYCPK
ncbi:MAG: hypothetical protein C0490_21850 [Marivirga sp.]|nr:hypothetical protein [Marivirga sp.]